MEIVSRPDMRSSEEAAAFLRKLRAILRLPRHLRRQHGSGLYAR
jgi:Asp-tRNA(Asn)/Glu-tRNA(Gln) amidotransferase B subunit